MPGEESVAHSLRCLRTADTMDTFFTDIRKSALRSGAQGNQVQTIFLSYESEFPA